MAKQASISWKTIHFDYIPTQPSPNLNFFFFTFTVLKNQEYLGLKLSITAQSIFVAVPRDWAQWKGIS
jgi:hypothetical protein